MKVKICGITNWSDARLAVAEGAEFLGFNFFAGSPRYVAPAKAGRIIKRLPKGVAAVGVFVNETEDAMLEVTRAAGLTHIQLHGDEPPTVIDRLKRSAPAVEVIKAVRVRAPFGTAQLARFKRANALLLDGFDPEKRGGTGKTFDWSVVRKLGSRPRMRIFLAGGLTPENVASAIETARPYAIDVCSGVEARPGKKDARRMKALLRAALGPRAGRLTRSGSTSRAGGSGAGRPASTRTARETRGSVAASRKLGGVASGGISRREA